MDFNDWLIEECDTSVRDVIDKNLGDFTEFMDEMKSLIREYCECTDAPWEAEADLIWEVCGLYDEQLRCYHKEE